MIDELLEFLVKELVDDANNIKIQKEASDDNISLKLEVPQDQIRYVIGKNGANLTHIKNMLSILAYQKRKKFTLELLDSNG